MSRQRYGRDIYNAMNDAIFVVDRASLQIVYANRVLADVAGLDQGALLGMALPDLYAEADRPAVTSHLAQIGEQIVQFGAHLLPRNGTPLYADTRITPGHQDGRAQLVCVISSPGQPSLAQALQESQTVYRSLVDALSDLIFRIRDDGTYLEFKIPDNLGLKMLAPDEIIGKKIADIVPQHVADLAMPAIARALHAQQPETIKYSILESSGLHHYDCCFVPSLENEVIAVVKDVTDQKQHEIILRIQRDLGVALSFETSLNHALELVVDASIRAAEMDCGGIYLIDAISGELDLAYQQGLSEEFVQVTRHYPPDTPQARLVMKGQPVYSYYPNLGIRLNGISQRENLRAIAIMPVSYQNQVIACINVASHRQDEVAPLAQHALESIAAQIGSAIVRIRAEEALRQKDRLLESVALAANRLMAVGEQEATFNDALAILGQRIDVDRAFVYELHTHPETGEPATSHRYSWSGPYLSTRADVSRLQNLPWQAFGLQAWYEMLAANQEVKLSRDTIQQLVPSHVPLAMKIESLLLMPVMVERRLWGFMGLSDHRNPREWAGEEINVLRIMASSLGAAIERQQAEDKLRHEREVADHERKMANTLREVGMVLTSTLELDAVLGRILEQALRVIPFDAANVFLLDGDVARMVHHQGYEAFGLSTETISQIAFNLEQTPLLQSMIRQGTPMVCPNVKNNDRWRTWPGFEWIGSWLGVPIVARGKVVAFFSFDSTTENFYNENHIRLIDPFAKQAAIAFENARLFEDTQRLERIKSEMIRMASHDLSSPLTRIKESIRRLKMEMGGSDSGRHVNVELLGRCGQDCEAAVNEMEQIVFNILSVERIEAQHQAARAIVWCELLAESVRTIRSELEAKQHQLDIECEPNLPVARGIRAQLLSAMSNLIGNAIKYTPAGGHIRVRLFRSSYGGTPTVAFEVQDDGIGIPQDLQAQIFDPFYRAAQAGTERTSGLGLGLSIVKATVKFHKGRVYFDSEPGKGSLFGFWIPV